MACALFYLFSWLSASFRDHWLSKYLSQQRMAGESVGIYDDYEVSTDVSVSEESEAKFGNVEMTNSKELAGSGDVTMAQTYSGSSGYVGNNFVIAQDSSSTISTSAILTPATLNAKLSGNIIGRSGRMEV